MSFLLKQETSSQTAQIKSQHTLTRNGTNHTNGEQRFMVPKLASSLAFASLDLPGKSAPPHQGFKKRKYVWEHSRKEVEQCTVAQLFPLTGREWVQLVFG